MISIILHCSDMTLRCTKLLSTSSSKQISFLSEVFIYLFLILAANLFNQELNLKIFLPSKRGLSLTDFYLALLPVFRVFWVSDTLDFFQVLFFSDETITNEFWE